MRPAVSGPLRTPIDRRVPEPVWGVGVAVVRIGEAVESSVSKAKR